MSVRFGTGMGSRQARLVSLVEADTSDPNTLRSWPCMQAQQSI